MQLYKVVPGLLSTESWIFGRHFSHYFPGLIYLAALPVIEFRCAEAQPLSFDILFRLFGVSTQKYKCC